MAEATLIPETSREDMLALLARQRENYLAEGVVSAAKRKDRIERAIGLLKTHQDRLVAAMRDCLLYTSPSPRDA